MGGMCPRGLNKFFILAAGAVHLRRINLRAATPLVILGDRVEGLQPRICVPVGGEEGK